MGNSGEPRVGRSCLLPLLFSSWWRIPPSSLAQESKTAGGLQSTGPSHFHFKCYLSWAVLENVLCNSQAILCLHISPSPHTQGSKTGLMRGAHELNCSLPLCWCYSQTRLLWLSTWMLMAGAGSQLKHSIGLHKGRAKLVSLSPSSSLAQFSILPASRITQAVCGHVFSFSFLTIKACFFLLLSPLVPCKSHPHGAKPSVDCPQQRCNSHSCVPPLQPLP